MQLEVRADSKMVVEWINGMAKQKTTVGAMEVAQEQLRQWWCRGVELCRRVDHWAVHIYREHSKDADAWAERGERNWTDEWEDDSKVVGSEVTGHCVCSGMGAVATMHAAQVC